MTDPIEFTRIFPSGFNTSPGNIIQTSMSTRLRGTIGGSTTQRIRYGYSDETQTDFTPIPARFACQATNFVKSVLLKGYKGNTVVSEFKTWLRVYREIWSPSINPTYRNYKNKDGLISIPNPFLPSRRQYYDSLPEEGSCSIPDDPYTVAMGQYVLLWLRWDGAGEPGPRTPYGVLFDWYWSGITDVSRQSVDLNQTPIRSSGNSKSRSTVFSTTGINSWSSVLGSNTYPGYYITNLNVYGTTDVRYLLQDDPENPTPQNQTQKRVSINVPEIKRQLVDINSSGIGLYKDADTGKIQPLGARPNQSAANFNGISLSNYLFSELTLDLNGYKYLIMVDEDTQFKLERHKAVGELGTFDLSQTGGKKIIPSGANQNYVEPNIKFGFTPNLPSVWEVSPRDTSQTLPVRVVDGAELSGLPADADNKWISGYAPTINSETERDAARAMYWYVLPIQTRTPQGGGCMCVKSTVSDPATNFTSPNSCYQGLHFGKFLKSDVDARGFSDGQLQDWVGAIDQKAKAELSNNLISTKFVGYYAHGSGYIKPEVTKITFSLNGVDGYRGGSKQTFPSSSYVGVGTSSANAQFNTGGTSSGSSSQSGYSGPPKDWKKILTDSMAKLLEGSAIDRLTPNRLSKILSQRVSEGAPLSLLKEIALKSILDAKLTVLQAAGKNKKQALKELENDPLYQSLVLAVNTTKKLARTATSGGTETGSTDSSNSENETRTIRINVVRGLPGYRPDIRPTASVVGQPELVQTYTVIQDGENISDSKPRRFVFPFVPREVNYSGIGANWQEIPRSGNYPIVDWTGFNLLKISFNFDIVDMKYAGIQGFGLNYSCEESIRTLREMAQTPYPVTFLNMDKFMQNEVRWPLLTSGRGIEFVIAEFSVTAVQRTGGGTIRDGTDSNQISRASCSMTLQEIPIETVDIVQMPKIVPCKKNCGGDIPTKEQLKEYLLFTSYRG